MMIVSARPMIRPLSTGGLMNSAREAEVQQARDQGGGAGRYGQAGGERAKAWSPTGARSATVAADRAAAAAIGPMTSSRELPSAA